MLRPAVGLSLSLVMMLGSAVACSSKPTDDPDTGGTAGRGTIISGGTSTGGTSTGGTSTSAEDCANAPVVCVDETTASTCDVDTGMDTVLVCAEESLTIGIISNGCTTDATGSGCSVDGFSDKGCEDGTAPFAVCEGYTRDELFDIYVACFLDEQGAHAFVPCYADFVDDAAMEIDCAGAQATCLPAM